MSKQLCYGALIFLLSCGQTNNNTEKIELNPIDTVTTSNKPDTISDFTLPEKSLKFLWRENKFDETINDSVSSIVIDEYFCKYITDHEKAALGYVATFIGNECSWDGESKSDRSNLKCKILDELFLGYQCSDTHLGFLRQMFKNDDKVLEELKPGNCPTTPDGSTIQETFDEINLTVNGNKILVNYKVSGYNMRENKSWEWNETQHFEYNEESLKLIKKEKSEVKLKNIDHVE